MTKKFHEIFELIKKCCKVANVPCAECYELLEKKVNRKKGYLSVTLYIRILQRMGMIQYNHVRKTVTLTQQGLATKNILDLVAD